MSNFIKANKYYNECKYKSAISYYKKSIEDGDCIITSYYNMATSYYRLKYYNKAIEYYDLVISIAISENNLNGEYKKSLFNKGLSFLNKGELKKDDSKKDDSKKDEFKKAYIMFKRYSCYVPEDEDGIKALAKLSEKLNICA